MTYWLLATLFMIMTVLTLIVFVNLPEFISSNYTYNLIFAFIPFIFGMLTVIVSIKEIR